MKIEGAGFYDKHQRKTSCAREDPRDRNNTSRMCGVRYDIVLLLCSYRSYYLPVCQFLYASVSAFLWDLEVTYFFTFNTFLRQVSTIEVLNKNAVEFSRS